MSVDLKFPRTIPGTFIGNRKFLQTLRYGKRKIINNGIINTNCRDKRLYILVKTKKRNSGFPYNIKRGKSANVFVIDFGNYDDLMNKFVS